MHYLLLIIIYSLFSKNFKTPLVQPMMIKTDSFNEFDNQEVPEPNKIELEQQEILALPSSVSSGETVRQFTFGEKVRLIINFSYINIPYIYLNIFYSLKHIAKSGSSRANYYQYRWNNETNHKLG